MYLSKKRTKHILLFFILIVSIYPSYQPIGLQAVTKFCQNILQFLYFIYHAKWNEEALLRGEVPAVLEAKRNQISNTWMTEYIQENIFTPLGMKDSGYDSNSDIIPQRASGYSPGRTGPGAFAPGRPQNAEGFEYILARVKFEHKGRYVSDILQFDLGNAPLQWVALSSELIEYERVSVSVPKPPLTGMVKPGGSVEGWVAFAVDKNDGGPVMVFDPDTGGATGRGRTLFFKLY